MNKSDKYLMCQQVVKMLTENEKKVVKALDARSLAVAEEYEIVEVMNRAAIMTGTAWTKTPDRFKINPVQHTVGLNS